MDELLTDRTLFSATVAQRRAALGQSQERAAAACAVTLRTYTRWEAGEALPQAETLSRVLSWLGLAVVSASSDALLCPRPGHPGGDASSGERP